MGRTKLNLRRPTLLTLLVCLAFPLLGPVAAAPVSVPATQASAGTSQEAETYRQMLTTLCDPSMEGRGISTKGIESARDYLTARFQDIGLRPAFAESYVQAFKGVFPAMMNEQELGVLSEDGDSLVECVAVRDYVALGISADGNFAGEAVFVGYSITDSQRRYSSYGFASGQMLRGKVAVAFRYEPQDGDGKSLWAKGERPWSPAASLLNKARCAADQGAVGLLVVNPPSRPRAPPPRSAKYARWPRMAGIPVIYISQDLFSAILMGTFKGGGRIARGFQELADSGADAPVDLGVVVRGRISRKFQPPTIHNVAAILPGAGDLASQVVVIGAHYDHLGYGRWAVLTGKRVLHPGAEDNASGTAGVVTLAKRFADRAASPAAPTNRRTLLFVAFTGEESGLLGSRYLVEHLEDMNLRTAQLVAMLNLDMIGRMGESLRVNGVDTGDHWEELVNRAADQCGLSVSLQAARPVSDHAAFYSRGIPALCFCTGMNPDLHTPADTPDKIDVNKTMRVLDMVEAIATVLWTEPETVEYTQPWISRAGTRMEASDRAYLGVMVEQVSVRQGGCKLGRIVPGSPADKAGLRAGDMIQECGGVKVSSPDALRRQVLIHKPGDVIRIKLLREDMPVEIDVKLGRRRP